MGTEASDVRAEQIRAEAEAWLADDPDPLTRAELSALIEAGDDAGLADRFGARLQFGTAGLRGEIGAGPNRMNRALVRRAAAGLAAWLQEHHADKVAHGVVIGFDARHKSDEFADDTAAVLAGAGIPAHLLPGPLPTPVLAFAVRHLATAAGVMVTASHNPPKDNGYKVYDHSGIQIVPPSDVEISEAIDAVDLSGVVVAPLDDPLVRRVGPDLLEAYLDAVQTMLPRAAGSQAGRPLRIVYSAMHGVGGSTVVRLLEQAGFGAPSVVAEQFEPDPDFPTVAFPNPEEPGAMDLTLALCRSTDADVALVNDPDADRLAVAVPDPSADGTEDDGWRMLRGDEVGVLLADAVLANPPIPSSDTAEREPVLACSLVSSQQLGRMAAAAGVEFEETLTGFKWVARSPGPDRRLLFGYEEALGYCVGDLVGDKDGVSALLALAQRIVSLRAEGETVLGRLDELSRIHGLHVTRQVSFRLEGAVGLARIAEAMDSLRNSPPTELAGRVVNRVDDLSTPAPGSSLPAADVLILRMEDARLIVRPSGTEPKLKCYLEVVRPVGEGDEALAAAHAVADAELSGLAEAITLALAIS